ncbi:MAG: putative ribonuclease, partial [Bryobacterales bacterium]|nr:putative ribonuclease [Bryobacterales bacterium]
KWSEHEAPRLGASVAFYSVLSFAPLLLLITAVIAVIFGQSSAQGTLVNEARQLIGNRGAETVQSLLKNAQKPSSGVIASIVAFVTLLYGASAVFIELQDALNRIWEAPAQTAEGVWGFLKQRLFSFGMVLSVGFLLLVSLILSTALAYLGKGFGRVLPVPAPVLEVFNLLASAVVIAALFALMFRYVPNVRVPWRNALLGAVTTTVLFIIGKFLLALYLGKASVGSTYGAAGSLVAVVVWIYYSAQIFFFGAEFTHVYGQTHGGEVAVGARSDQQKSDAVPKAPATPEPAVAARAAAAFGGSAGASSPVSPGPASGNSPAPSTPIPAAPSFSAHPPEPSRVRQVSTPVNVPVPMLGARVQCSTDARPAKPKLLWALGIGFVLGRYVVSAHGQKRA